MYGAGLRINECLRLRVKDVNFSMGYIVVREGKGAKDRRTLLPESLKEPLQNYRDTQHSSQLFIIGIRVGTNYVPTLPGWIPACAGMTVVLGLSKCHSGRIRGYTPSRAAAPGHSSSRGISESVHVAGKAGQSPRE
jgi:hypothetical protein